VLIESTSFPTKKPPDHANGQRAESQIPVQGTIYVYRQTGPKSRAIPGRILYGAERIIPRPGPRTARHPDMVCVALISRGRGFADSTDGQLAETMAVSLATVKRSLLRLERSGWIYREQVDSRRVIALIPDAHADQDLRLRVLS
jgi:hypothetical protein